MHLGVRMDERRRSQTRGTNRNQGEPSLVTEPPPDRTAGCRRFPTRRDCSAACASALSSRWFCCSLSPPPCPIFLLRNVLVDRLDEEITVALGREAEEFEILADGTAYGRAPSATTSPQSSDLYFDREVPDEGETLLAFVDERLHDTEHAQTAVPANRLDDAIANWLPLRTREAHAGHRSRHGPLRRGAVHSRGSRGERRANLRSGDGADCRGTGVERRAMADQRTR